MKKPAFHIFKILDCYFMFDVKNCIFYKINKIFLTFCQYGIQKSTILLMMQSD